MKIKSAEGADLNSTEGRGAWWCGLLEGGAKREGRKKEGKEARHKGAEYVFGEGGGRGKPHCNT